MGEKILTFEKNYIDGWEQYCCKYLYMYRHLQQYCSHPSIFAPGPSYYRHSCLCKFVQCSIAEEEPTKNAQNLNNARKITTVNRQTFNFVQCSVPMQHKTASSDLCYNNWYPLWPWCRYRNTESGLQLSCTVRKENFWYQSTNCFHLYVVYSFIDSSISKCQWAYHIRRSSFLKIFLLFCECSCFCGKDFRHIAQCKSMKRLHVLCILILIYSLR